jgi:hypothetical protein
MEVMLFYRNVQCNLVTQTVHVAFYFGVLHPVARTLSRLLKELSLATTLQGVFILYFIFCRYMFRPLLAIFRRNTQLF